MCRWSGRMDYEQDTVDYRRGGLDALAQRLHGHLMRRAQIGESGARRACPPAPGGRSSLRPRSAVTAASRSRLSSRMALIPASLSSARVSPSPGSAEGYGNKRDGRQFPRFAQYPRSHGGDPIMSTSPVFLSTRIQRPPSVVGSLCQYETA
jgi:hypothetical protein